jgi:hypothetical protein
MRGLLSLEQELRAARMDSGQKKGNQSNHTPDPKQNERPWQRDIDQVQQTMRELLRIVASLSGVELPGLPPGLQDDAAPPPRLDINTLKDRIRNELEGFSIKTTEELAKRAKEKTRAALDAVQNEVGGLADQVAAEVREKLQLPAQIEKLLEPCVEETAARLEKSFCEKVEHLFAEQKRLVQDTLQAALSSVQTQIGTLEQTVQQIRELKAGSVAQLSADRPNTAAGNATKEHENRQNTELDGFLEEAFSRIKGAFNNFVETPRTQPGQSTVAGLEAQRNAPPFDNTNTESRVQQALDQLGRLGPKNPHSGS